MSWLGPPAVLPGELPEADLAGEGGRGRWPPRPPAQAGRHAQPEAEADLHGEVFQVRADGGKGKGSLDGPLLTHTFSTGGKIKTSNKQTIFL